MGLFSSKKRTTVTLIAERMMSDTDFKYAHQSAMRYYLQERGASITTSIDDKMFGDYVVTSLQNALPSKANKSYRYAKKSGRYVFGLPTGSMVNNPQEQLQNAMIGYLKKLHGKELMVYRTFIDDKNLYMTAWLRLIEQYGYDSVTNQLTKIDKGVPVYLVNGFLQLTQYTMDSYAKALDNPSVSFAFNALGGRGIDYERDKKPVVLGNSDKAIFEIQYTQTEQIEEIVTNADTGDKETITKDVEKSYTENIEVDLSDINPELAEGMILPSDADYLYATYGVDDVVHWFGYKYGSGGIYELDSSLIAKDSIGEFYPRYYIRINQSDFKDTKDIVRLKSSERIYKKLGLDINDVTNQIIQGVGGEYGDIRGGFITLAVPVNTERDDVKVNEYLFRYMEKIFLLTKPVTVINQDGTTSVKEHMHQGFTQAIQDNVSNHSVGFNQIEMQTKQGKATFNNGKALSKGDYCGKFTVDVHEFYHQISDDEYIVYRVFGLNSYISVSGYGSSVSGADEKLLIPLDKAFIKELTNKEQQLVMNKSLHIIMIHVKVTKVKWYQRGIFKLVIGAIGIAISVFTAGAGTPISTILLGVVKSAVIGYVSGLALTKLAKIAVEKWNMNPELVGALAFVGVVVGAKGSANWSFANMKYANVVMKASNTAFQAYQKAGEIHLAEAYQNMNNFNQSMKEKYKDIQRARQLLNTGVVPMDVELLSTSYRSQVDLFDTPETFYDRAMNIDIVDKTIYMVDGFVEYTMRLPKHSIVTYDTDFIPVTTYLII